ncbi:MAG TPA: flagellar assembly protein FliW [Acidobacteriota bacterium]|nr:flagellar assembly protein FliW [Acidobacteriota bacterium]
MSTETLTVQTNRFGEITVKEEDMILFPKGLLGFEEHRRFFLLTAPEYAPFAQMQSLDDPALTFVVLNPSIVFPHYKVEVDPREIAELEVTDVKKVLALGIVTVPDDVSRMSVNLQGPVLLNQHNNRAKQVVLVHSPYTTCHYIADELQRRQTRTDAQEKAPVTA